MPHCRICAILSFQDLPNEEEKALPHQSSLDALSESAKSCTLCKLILLAAACSLTSPAGIVTHKPPVELPDGREVTTRVWDGNYDTIGVMRALFNGAVIIDTRNAQADLGDPWSIDLHARFPTGSNVRPWLFGNWYRSPYRDRSPRLVGLGVRLGTGPWLEEAEGNSATNVDIKGTYL
ncbi:hypothetical protein BDZ45DRAFT_480508 [Acephala macrosclerotiorum]|nr:hypothetical protein BDZ45DRAFT_480508 [Acephala macrosclerotiorum]